MAAKTKASPRVATGTAQLDLFLGPTAISAPPHTLTKRSQNLRRVQKLDYFSWVMGSALRPGSPKVLMMVLAAHADAEGICRFSIRDLADEVGLSVTRVRFYIDCLISSSTLLLRPWVDPRHGTQLGFVFRIVRTVDERMAALAAGFEPKRRSKFDKTERAFRPPLRIVGR